MLRGPRCQIDVARPTPKLQAKVHRCQLGPCFRTFLPTRWRFLASILQLFVCLCGCGRMAARETLCLHQRDLSRTPKPTRSVPVVREPELSADETTPYRPVDQQEAKQSGWMPAAQAGDTDANRPLLTEIQPRIRAIVRSKIREEAAAGDVVQNALLSIHRGRRTYRGERPFGPWMRAVVRNSIIDHFGDRKRKGDLEVELVVEEWADEREESAEGDSQLASELTAPLSTLPGNQREAVTLIQIEGLSVAEAALKTGVSAGAIKVRAHRGYRARAKALEGKRLGREWKSERPTDAAGLTGDQAKETK